MQIIENLKVKEKAYIEKLENGLTVIIIPKQGVSKKYVIFGLGFQIIFQTLLGFLLKIMIGINW